ncbi:MAG TPA: extracellular solute-binding protein, partial [Dermatophilaceae bacterium]|nr:extracellular solute-binding protein [Dermatophilaceae bacterium]
MSNQVPSASEAAWARGLISRRTAMVGMAGVSAVVGLAACGSAGTGSTSATAKSRVKAATDLSATEKIVNWSNWPSYMDVDEKTKKHPTLDAFTKQTGIKVNYTEDYNDNNEFYAKVRPLLEAGQDTGRDLWASTDWMAARMIRLNYVQKLDLASIPNHGNVEDALLNVTWDKGRLFSLPWQSGMTGIAWNPKSTGGKKIESMDQLLTDPKLKGKVTLLTEMPDTIGLVLIAMGKDPAAFTDADFDAACAEIQKAKDAGQLKGFTGNEYTKPLASG